MTDNASQQGKGVHAQALRPRALVLTVNDPVADPRVGWVASTLAERFDVIEVGMFRGLPEKKMPELEDVAAHHRRVRLPATPWPAYVPQADPEVFAGNAGWATLAGFAYETADQDPVIAHRRKRAPLTQQERDRHEEFRRMLRTNASLIRAGRALGPAAVIVAADLEALPAGVALKHNLNARLIYDAHEFWPYSFPQFRSREEEQAWVKVERGLVREADACFVVSPGLAEAMTKEYGTPFGVLPNAVPMSEAPSRPARKTKDGGKVEFLFIGRFAPQRGLQQLIKAWPQTDERAVLVLQGPDDPLKRELVAMAQATGLYGSRILFPAPVPESRIVETAAQADVGLVPYEPTLLNHVHCSPNKLSQYMAAGIPILANATVFVGETVRRADCGAVANFDDAAALAAEVGNLVNGDQARKILGDNARRAFETFFHWEAFSPALLAAVGDAKAAEGARDIAVALEAEFGSAEPAAEKPPSSIASVGKSVLRLGMRAVWHGVPFLRVIVLSHPRFRRRAESLREK